MQRKSFKEWLVSVADTPKPENLEVMSDFIQANRPKSTNDEINAEVGRRFLREVHEAIEKGVTDRYFMINNYVPGNGSSAVSYKPEGFKGGLIGRLLVQSQGGDTITFANFDAIELELSNIDGPVILRHMFIKRLNISGTLGNLRIEECSIGAISFSVHGVKVLAVHGGEVLCIHAPPPKEKNPFKGSVLIDDACKLAAKPNEFLPDAQPYRNLRSHLIELENMVLANRMHSLEQSVDWFSSRWSLSSWFPKVISWAYWVISDYGSSMGWPLFLLLCVSAVTCGGLFWFDAVALTTEEKDLIGWYANLKGTDCFARVSRAGFFTLQSTINPLGIFAAKGIIAAKTGWAASWLVLHGLLSLVFITLFVLAIRRRFKIAS